MSTRSCAAFVMASLVTGCATVHGPRSVDDGARPSQWSRVSELQPGAQIEVATTSAQLRARIFVSADSLSVTVLSLEVPSLPPIARRALRDMATRHSEYFTAMLVTGSLEQNGVRLGRDGLFVDDCAIAAFAQVVETHPREAVREIRGPVVARGSVLGTIVGVWLGFSAGVVPGLGGAQPAVATASLFGAIMGGGWLGHRWSSHAEEGVVYVAP
jgi:hypothetical protein